MGKIVLPDTPRFTPETVPPSFKTGTRLLQDTWMARNHEHYTFQFEAQTNPTRNDQIKLTTIPVVLHGGGATYVIGKFYLERHGITHPLRMTEIIMISKGGSPLIYESNPSIEGINLTSFSRDFSGSKSLPKFIADFSTGRQQYVLDVSLEEIVWANGARVTEYCDYEIIIDPEKLSGKSICSFRFEKSLRA